MKINKDPETMRFLEKIAALGYVALESVDYGGWQLRFTEGFTGRVNSVLILGDTTDDLEKRVEYCEKEYASRGLPCMFKLTEADTELVDLLLQRGYQAIRPTDVMTLELSDVNTAWDREEILKDVVYGAEPEDWFEPYFGFEELNDEHNRELCKKIHAKVASEKVYIKVMQDGKIAALASLAIEEGFSLLHNVVVDKSLRGRGLGEKLCRAAVLISKDCGADYSYLQVMQSNPVAMNLYKKLGFEKVYTYCYVKEDK